MKKSIYIIAAFVVSGFMLQAGQVKAQSSVQKKEKAEQEKQFAEQKRAIEETYAKEQELKYIQARDLYRIQERSKYITLTPPIEPVAPIIWGLGSSDKSFSLSLRKNFAGESVTKKTSFTIDDDQKKLRISVKGSCMEGSIVVKFSLPSGKSFSQIEIDSSADIDWSQSLLIEDKSNYKGLWNVEVKAIKARGMYSVSITSY